MYWSILAPVHAPNLAAPVGFNEKAISYSSPPARAGTALAFRSSAPSMMPGDSTTTHFVGFVSGLVSWPGVVAASARSMYLRTRRFAGMFPPLLREAIASCSVVYVWIGDGLGGLLTCTSSSREGFPSSC